MKAISGFLPQGRLVGGVQRLTDVWDGPAGDVRQQGHRAVRMHLPGMLLPPR